MKKALVTGSGGLVGSETVKLLIEDGYDVIGIDNDKRSYFFGEEASTKKNYQNLFKQYDNYQHYPEDISDYWAIENIFRAYNSDVEIIVHTAAQPSHDWAAKEPHTDFYTNAVGTLNLLQATRDHCPDATFCHISTSKVYGDNPNRIGLVELDKRYDVPKEHEFYNGITPKLSIDNCLHSLFGVSKASGDLLVQEYGRYFDIPTVCFRPGCVTGSAHAGTELHGFLNYLMKCAVTGRKYTVYGYKGKQVRCNIHGADLAKACLAFHKDPYPGAVYNIGGGRQANCSMLEAIDICEKISANPMNYEIVDVSRIGDHMWWISDNRHFEWDYADWSLNYTIFTLLEEIYDNNYESWVSE